jgi:hypothetical protein
MRQVPRRPGLSEYVEIVVLLQGGELFNSMLKSYAEAPFERRHPFSLNSTQVVKLLRRSFPIDSS